MGFWGFGVYAVGVSQLLARAMGAVGDPASQARPKPLSNRSLLRNELQSLVGVRMLEDS